MPENFRSEIFESLSVALPLPTLPRMTGEEKKDGEGRLMTITIWHNPRCSKSRETLELLKKKGVAPAIREYLKEPPSKAEVEKLLDMVGGEPAALIRDGEAEFKALKKKKADLSRTDIVKAIAAHPVLLQRPIVVAGKRAAIGRPPEAVLPLLK
jgi:arsenate reductase (glutaredoxin)